VRIGRATLLVFLIGISAGLCFTTAAQAVETTAIAMHGVPKYADGFDHFDYVNPNAPKGGALRLGITGTFDSLNPFIVRGQPPLGLNTGLMSLVYEPLMMRSADEPLTLYGLLADKVDIADDRSSITFHINKSAHWSDNVPVTADDVLFSYETLKSQGRPNHRTYYKKVAQAAVLDPQRIRFTFKPNADGSIDREMPLIMALMPILPRHDWQDRPFNQTTLRTPVGSGPYIINAMDTGRSITYARNPHYWAAALPVMRGLDNFDKIQVDYYRDDGVALQAFKAGQFDMRFESNINRWATAYDFPAAKDGRVKMESMVHSRAEPATGFIFNTRRAPFTDPKFRAALMYSFDSGWINRNLFHGLYHRVSSYFPNTSLAAPTLPDAAEQSILRRYETQLPPDLFTDPVTPADTDGTEESARSNLLEASTLLHDAGYTLIDNKLYAPNSDKSVTFEILLSDPSEEKLALVWMRSLARIGISARVHTVDSAQYQARLAQFDFDVISGRWINSLSPGNEQTVFWGSAAADQPGSRNYAGIKSPAIDALVAAIPNTKRREDLVAMTHALDRLLLAGHYMIPLFYAGADNVAYWNKLHHPDVTPITGTVREAWWSDKD